MSYNGSGTFVINTAGQPVVSGTVISSTAFNALTADLATGLSTAITKDGQTTPTANIPMGNNKITGLAVGTAATDAANLSQVQSTTAKLITASGTDTVTGTLSPTLTAYAAGQMFYWVAAGTNTGAVTLNIDSLGAKAVTRDGSTALAAGDIRSGEVVVVVYDGTRFQVVSQINSSGDATFANVSITSALNVGGVSTFTGLITANGGVSGALNGTVGATTPNTGAFTTLTTSSTVTLSGGTANGVLYLNGSKVATSGSALVFDGTNLGVGTSTPGNYSSAAYNLVIAGTGQRGMTIASTNSDQCSLFFADSDTGTGEYAGYLAYFHNTDGLAFGANAAEQMRLTSTGLGIGTSSPAFKLDVVGTSQVKPSTGTDAIWTRTSNNSGEFYLGTDNSAGSGFTGTAYARFLYSTGAYPITFHTNGIERMRLDSSGNLGIGVTPANFDSSTVKALQIGAQAAFAAESNVAHVLTNAYYNAAWKYIGTGNATDYYQLNGTHVWRTAASGTANNNITWTQAMTLDASGNLLVGGTSTVYGAAGRGNIEANGSSSATLGLTVGAATAGLLLHDGTDSYYRNYKNGYFAIWTNNTERARITSGGDLLVGATSGTGGRLYVSGGSDQSAILGTTSTLNYAGVQGAHTQNSATAYVAYFANSGSGTGLYISNTAAWQSTSDERLKTDIKDLNSTEKLMQLRPRDYLWKSQETSDTPDKRNFGFIAQEVQEVFPDLVGVSPDGMFSVEYTGLIAPLVKAVQELKAELEAAKVKIAALETK